MAVFSSTKKPKVIAVFGRTGAGKSTFIKNVTGANLKIGHSLESYAKLDGIDVVLADTPGFDDSDLPDTKVLSRLANWLKYTYDEGTLLSGLIYLHPLTEGRMYGSAKKQLLMFQKLCGASNLKNVMLVTTMWDRVPKDQAEEREGQLEGTYWKEMLQYGATTERVDNDPASAKALVQNLIQRQEITVRLQQELADGKSLPQTDAGAVLNAEFNKVRQECEKRLEAVRGEERAKWQGMLEANNKKQKKLEAEKIAQLPKQTRRWWQWSWPCLKDCGPVTKHDGVWQCPSCHQKQYNVRY